MRGRRTLRKLLVGELRLEALDQTLSRSARRVGDHVELFVVVSFDGFGGRPCGATGEAWRKATRTPRSSSRHYLIDSAHRRELTYRPTGRAATRRSASRRRASIAATQRSSRSPYRDGDEIGTHYNGHFCGAAASATGRRTTAARAGAVRLSCSSTDRHSVRPVRGRRRPHSVSRREARRLYPVLAQRGFRTTRAARRCWARGRKRGRHLELPFPRAPVHRAHVPRRSMDYNFMANQIGEPPAQVEAETYRTLWNAFLVSYRGNRAPDARQPLRDVEQLGVQPRAARASLLRACRYPNVRCASSAARELARRAPVVRRQGV